MPKVKGLQNAKGYYLFECPGCKCSHCININPEYGCVWDFNKDMDKPTVSPSLLVHWKDTKGKHVCHSFIKNGMIQFLSDCTHELAGKTIELPNM